MMPTFPISVHAGCGCKASGCDLEKALRAAGYLSSSDGFTPEDSALRKLGDERLLLSTDGGIPVCPEVYDAAYISVVHACSDIYARGGRPNFVMSTIMLADDSQETLNAILSGVREASQAEGAEIVNGQTIRGQENFLSMSIIGTPMGDHVLSKRGANVGDRIMISKPVGTGLILRATALEAAGQDETQFAIRTMKQSNRPAMIAALTAGASSCTDITGFGIVGHLSEMLLDLGAEVSMRSIPLLPGARRLAAEIGESFWTRNNLDYARRSHIIITQDNDDISQVIISDPQTSGPLVATVKPDTAAILEAAGFVEIGIVTAGKDLLFE